MQRQIKRGAAANAGLIFHIFVQDSASTTGAGKTALAYSNFTVRYIRSGEALSGAITPEDITTIGTYAAPTASTNIRIKKVDDTHMPGVYEVHIHADWVNTTNACQSLTIYFSAAGAAVRPWSIPLVACDPQDSVRLGLTALPSAAAEAAGGLFTRGTGAGQINQAANGQIDANATAASAGVLALIEAAVMDTVNGVENGVTHRQALRAIASVLAGAISDAGTSTETFKALGNPGTTRVTVSVDASGNRSSVTLNL